MKLKVIKRHYFNGIYKRIGEIYVTDIVKGKSLVKNGLCQDIKMPTRADKILENKKHPKTRKKAIKIK